MASHSRLSAPPAIRLRLPPLRLGFRLDQIGEPLRFGQVHLAVQERAPGELAGLRQPQVPAGPEAARASAAGTARPPVTCSSTTSSPVKLRGAAKRVTSARSSGAPETGSFKVRRTAVRSGKAAPGASAASAAAQSGPGDAEDRDRGFSDAARLREYRVLIVREHRPLGPPDRAIACARRLRRYFDGGVQTTYWSAIASWSPCFSRWK